MGGIKVKNPIKIIEKHKMKNLLNEDMREVEAYDFLVNNRNEGE